FYAVHAHDALARAVVDEDELAARLTPAGGYLPLGDQSRPVGGQLPGCVEQVLARFGGQIARLAQTRVRFLGCVGDEVSGVGGSQVVVPGADRQGLMEDRGDRKSTR